MFLKVLSSYTCRAVHYRKDQQIEVTEVEGEMLLKDSPESFKVIKKIEEVPPPGSKAMTAAKRSDKAVKEEAAANK
jgi:hypothetical protein